MVGLWGDHRRAAQQACIRLARAQRNEAEHRAILGERFRRSAGRVRNLFWVAVTGAAWVSRRHSSNPPDRRNPLVELAAAGLLAWRWRSIQDRIATALIAGPAPADLRNSDGR